MVNYLLLVSLPLLIRPYRAAVLQYRCTKFSKMFICLLVRERIMTDDHLAVLMRCGHWFFRPNPSQIEPQTRGSMPEYRRASADL